MEHDELHRGRDIVVYCYEFESIWSNANKSVSDVKCCGIGDFVTLCPNKNGGLEVQTEIIGPGVM